MGLIPDEVIETVRLRSDIVEVVSRYVQLKKAGKSYKGVCPFHSERAPSFTVTPDKQIFHCFGCNAGGDVFRFLMLKEGLTFFEAVGLLAERAGVVIPASESPAGRENGRKREVLKQINNLARDFFHTNLLRHGEADHARRYLTGRGISPEALERFQLGYALPGWSSLLEYLGTKGFSPDEVAQAGLVAKSEAGRYYDRFRGRVIFPIWDATGRVVGFGGRVLDDTTPKYLNTPETPSFSKGRTLYGLHLARQSIREKGYVLMVEGYMDVVTAHLHGVTNAVASLGTALTVEQGKLLINYSRDVLIAYDADTAGVAATIRSLDLLQELGCQVRVVSIPDGKDPDEFLRRQGYQSWEKLVSQSPSLIEYKLLQAAGSKPANSVSGKLEVMQQVFPNLAALKSEVEREEGLKAISRVLNLSWETVAGELRRFNASQGKKWTNRDNIVKNRYTILNKEEKTDTRGRAEAGILRLVLEDPSLGTNLLEELGEETFKNTGYQRIFRRCMVAADRSDYRPVDLFNGLTEDDQEVLSKLLTQEIPGENLVFIMNGYVDSINRCNRQELREKLLKEIGEAEKSGDHGLYNDLWRDYMVLRGIAEAEKSGDQERLACLLQKYRQCLDSKKPVP